MKKAFLSLFTLMVSALFATNLRADLTFVYTNDDVNPNTVSAFGVDASGFLTPVPGSPFPTGGIGGGAAFTASRITTVGNFLYVSNGGSNNVSAFSIDSASGVLTPVAGSPFATGGTAGSIGISLAGTPDGNFLYAINGISQDVRIFHIGPGGELTPVGPLVPTGVRLQSGAKVSPDGQWLAVVLGSFGLHGAVAMFSIDSTTGELAPVAGSPFPIRPSGENDGRAIGIDINCASDTLFVGEVTPGTTVLDVFSINQASGALTPIPNSPFESGGVNSSVPLLCTDDTILYVSNQGFPLPATVSSYTVAADGSLSLVPGSPFSAGPGALEPVGMATDQAGTFLFVANVNAGVSVYGTDSTGFLMLVPGSPFPTGRPRGLRALAAFPPKVCPR